MSDIRIRPVHDYMYQIIWKLGFRPGPFDKRVISTQSQHNEWKRIFWKFYWRVS